MTLQGLQNRRSMWSIVCHTKNIAAAVRQSAERKWPNKPTLKGIIKVITLRYAASLAGCMASADHLESCASRVLLTISSRSTTRIVCVDSLVSSSAALAHRGCPGVRFFGGKVGSGVHKVRRGRKSPPALCNSHALKCTSLFTSSCFLSTVVIRFPTIDDMSAARVSFS